MEGQEPEALQKVLPFIKNNLLLLGIFSAGLIFLGIGLIQFFTPRQDLEFKSAEQTTKASLNQDEKVQKITVDVSGAVQKPGVYELSENSRIKDAVVLAGGFSSDADTTLIAKTINLAQKINDGQKIYIPQIGDESSQVLGSQTGLININSASESELDTLAGVGKVTAQKIIKGRPYASLEDLVTKKAVTQKVFDNIKDQITY